MQQVPFASAAVSCSSLSCFFRVDASSPRSLLFGSVIACYISLVSFCSLCFFCSLSLSYRSFCALRAISSIGSLFSNFCSLSLSLAFRLLDSCNFFVSFVVESLLKLYLLGPVDKTHENNKKANTASCAPSDADYHKTVLGRTISTHSRSANLAEIFQ